MSHGREGRSITFPWKNHQHCRARQLFASPLHTSDQIPGPIILTKRADQSGTEPRHPVYDTGALLLNSTRSVERREEGRNSNLAWDQQEKEQSVGLHKYVVLCIFIQ